MKKLYTQLTPAEQIHATNQLRKEFRLCQKAIMEETFKSANKTLTADERSAASCDAGFLIDEMRELLTCLEKRYL